VSANGSATSLRSDGTFIAIEVDEAVATDRELAAKLTEVCPVDIYASNDDGTLQIVQSNIDECVLCRLCLDATPAGSVRVLKLYDGGSALE
jgi:NAD-dependent dihydropyrimidine dehydrogenase PreA subunit